jgi:uncharacterized membrane protein YjjP (DUF1212 family)
MVKPRVILAALVGFAIGLLVGIGITRTLRFDFLIAFMGAVVGGVLAMLASYLGSREMIDRDERREQQDLIRAIQVARSEISTNAALLTDMVARHFENFISVHLHDSDFRQVNTVLARGLPMDLFGEIGTIMNRVRHVSLELERAKRVGGRGLDGQTAQECTELRDNLNRVNKRLLNYARTKLKVEIPTAIENPFIDRKGDKGAD